MYCCNTPHIFVLALIFILAVCNWATDCYPGTCKNGPVVTCQCEANVEGRNCQRSKFLICPLFHNFDIALQYLNNLLIDIN